MDIEELQELIRLNNEEKFNVIKEYLKMYWLLIIKNDSLKRKTVLKKLKEYLRTINLENEIYIFIEKNLEKIKDIKELEKLIKELDNLNEKTYSYYDQLLVECENYIGTDYNIVPYKNFKTIIETDDYKNKAIGLILTFDDILSFYELYNIKYLLSNIKIIDSDEEKAIGFYGVHPREQDGKIVDIRLCVPKVKNLKTALINVHELKHGIDLLPQIGKRYQEMDYEMAAKEKEKQFIKEYLPRKWKV